jgi:hypothetical protein
MREREEARVRQTIRVQAVVGLPLRLIRREGVQDGREAMVREVTPVWKVTIKGDITIRDITVREATVREGTTVREDTPGVINRAGVGVGVGLGIVVSEGMVWEGTRNSLAANYHGAKGRHSAKRLENRVEAEPGLADIIVTRVLGLSKKRKTLLRFHPFLVGAVT